MSSESRDELSTCLGHCPLSPVSPHVSGAVCFPRVSSFCTPASSSQPLSPGSSRLWLATPTAPPRPALRSTQPYGRGSRASDATGSAGNLSAHRSIHPLPRDIGFGCGHLFPLGWGRESRESALSVWAGNPRREEPDAVLRVNVVGFGVTDLRTHLAACREGRASVKTNGELRKREVYVVRSG